MITDIIKSSINKVDNCTIYLGYYNNDKKLIIENNAYDFIGVVIDNLTICDMNHDNACILRKILPFTAPSKVLSKERSFGLGDRLGIASIGHARLFMDKYDAYPLFAQQSIRELNLTNRTFEDVLDKVTYQVLECGYKRGFGADADHLKHEEDIENALRIGYTMLTLDCSEHIKLPIDNYDDVKVSDDLMNKYLNKSFNIEDIDLSFTLNDLKECVYIYMDAIEFAKHIYFDYVKGNDVDLELSIDETMSSTTPLQHFFVANELLNSGVVLATVAPRFCGEFQKGIDYIGNLEQFEYEMKIHAAIARFFNYKLSIHSGSDKFSTFEIIGKYTKGHFHVKTAGTNWLEAMKVVAIKDPSLYRNIHKYAISKFLDACKFYHVTTNLNNIPSVDDLKDEELPLLFNNNDSRQLIHITYGFILTDKENDIYIFRDKLYTLWDKEKELYYSLLESHIGHHLELLYKGFNK